MKRVYDIREKAAGLKSSKFSKSIEPPLQHKRLVHSESDDNAGGKKIPIAKKHESDGHVTENPTKTEVMSSGIKKLKVTPYNIFKSSRMKLDSKGSVDKHFE